MKLLLNKEEYEFIKRFCNRALVLIDMKCDMVDTQIDKKKIEDLLKKMGDKYKSS